MATQSDIKLIISDLDGTLLQNKIKTIDPQTITFINKIIDEYKVGFAIASGRNILECLPVVQELNIKPNQDFYIIVCNGAATCNLKTKEYINVRTISNGYLQKFLVFFQQTYPKFKKQSMFQIYRMNKVFNNNDIPEYLTYNSKMLHQILSCASKSYAAGGHARRKIIDLVDTAGIDDCLKIMVYFEDVSDQILFSQIIKKHIDFANFEITSSDKFNVEITAHGASKGEALKSLIAYLHIDFKQTLPIGDGENDVSMLKLSPNSSTLISSTEFVKSFCKHVVDCPQNKFVYEVLKLFFNN
ncbi:MAG: Cof-type HAD-IIB family hydrolase [Mycoplasmataceae bacterium]|jgi:Cof subfamily protein (haloacid dehalogenase superfamily)|nr:Cof-type HAD-IIB family hydrolase [Mycoplasmataceae bacterium]